MEWEQCWMNKRGSSSSAALPTHPRRTSISHQRLMIVSIDEIYRVVGAATVVGQETLVVRSRAARIVHRLDGRIVVIKVTARVEIEQWRWRRLHSQQILCYWVAMITNRRVVWRRLKLTRLRKNLHCQFLLLVDFQFSIFWKHEKREGKSVCEIRAAAVFVLVWCTNERENVCMLCACTEADLTHFSIHNGFSVVLRSSIICFLIKASFLRVSVGMEITQFLRQKQSTMKLMAPTKSTINRAIIAARAMSNSSGAVDGNAGITFSIANPWDFLSYISMEKREWKREKWGRKNMKNDSTWWWFCENVENFYPQFSVGRKERRQFHAE